MDYTTNILRVNRFPLARRPRRDVGVVHQLADPTVLAVYRFYRARLPKTRFRALKTSRSGIPASQVTYSGEGVCSAEGSNERTRTCTFGNIVNYEFLSSSRSPGNGAKSPHHLHRRRRGGIETIKLRVGRGSVGGTLKRGVQRGCWAPKPKLSPKFIYRSPGSCFRAARICVVHTRVCVARQKGEEVWNLLVIKRTGCTGEVIEYNNNNKKHISKNIPRNRKKKSLDFLKLH